MNRFFEHLIGLPINILTLGYYWMVIIDMHHCMVDSEFDNKAVIKELNLRYWVLNAKI
jgi:uncharacterized membrane protein YvlD (DUF360 family)